MNKLLHYSESRGRADHGWLKSRHTFSFADYYNPERMNFGVLRVLNDDRIAGGSGFGTHPHNNMEIVSIPIQGALAHKDTEGNSAVITTGEVQVMSAGTGIAHSEFNASATEEAQFLQIWILPKQAGVAPRYDQKKFNLQDRVNKFQLVVSPDGREGSLMIHQDAFFSLIDLAEGNEAVYTKKLTSNGIYLFLVDGELETAEESLRPRDALAITDAANLRMKALQDSKVLIIEVPLRLS